MHSKTGVWSVHYCKCVSVKFLKKNNNLATPRFPPVPVSIERVVSPFDLYGPLRWIRCPAGVVATDWFMDGVNVGSLTAHPSLLLSLLLLVLLLLLLLSHSSSFCPQMCLFMCRARWSDREKHLQRKTEKPCHEIINLTFQKCMKYVWKIQEMRGRKC